MNLRAGPRSLLSRYRTRTLTRDLALTLMTIATAVLIVAGAANSAVNLLNAERNLNQQADALADELADVLAAPLWTLDLNGLQQIATAYRRSENVAGLVIVDETGVVLYRSVPEEADPFMRTRTIYHDQRIIGQLEVWLSRQSLRPIRESALATTATAILLVGLGILVTTDLLLRRYLERPLLQLTRGIDHIAAGHYTAPLAPVPQADINLIIAKVNAMAGQIADRDAALREREEKFRQVVTSISDHIYFAEITSEGAFVPRYLSPHLAQLTGYPLETFFEDPHFWLEHVVFPDDRAAVRAEAQRQAAGESSELEYRLRARSGQVFWVRDSVRAEPAGASQFLYGVISDITQRKRAEQVQTATYRLSEAAQAAPTLEELYSALHTIIGELMPAQNFYIALYHAPTHLLHFVYHADEHESNWEPLRPERTLTGYVLQTGRSLLATPEVFEQLVQTGQVDQVGEASQDWLGVPLMTQQAVIGVMVVQTYQDTARLGEADRDLLTFVSTQVAMAIERKRAEEDLRLDEARLDALAQLNEMTEATEKAISDFAMAEAIRLTGSTVGCLCFLNEAETMMTMYSWSGAIVTDSEAAQAYPAFSLSSEGVWGEVIRQRKPVIVNHPDPSVPQPDQHMPMRRYAIAPVFEGEHITAVAGVGNKEEPYDEADVRQLTLLMQGMWRILQRRRAAAEIRQLNVELEQRVEDRTAELSARTAQLTAANQELEAFAYSVSHDLRAPLRAINGFSQTLLEDYPGQFDAEAQARLGRIRAATERMAQLIDDLLKLSRITRSDMQLRAVDLSELVQELVAELRAVEPTRQVEIHLPKPCVVRADADLMRIALDNLLDNAWKFTRPRPLARIEFGYREQAGQTVFFVSDNGAGFDAAFADKLFGAFQRLHTADEFEGTGIGLAIVQRIIHRHGGQIWAEGTVDGGATFYFTLGKRES
jgi:PAS domain S-box-containing protein